ncbi:MAG: asparagine synthase (glutamine-hydrolyzing) [Nitrospirota bacterium]
MSGIAGILHRDGQPVNRADLWRLTDCLAHRGPDGHGHWINGPVGLGHVLLQTTPESSHERQPWSDESGRLCLTLDGRVDNRDELQGALEGAGATFRNETDAELVLRAYECWGEGCAKRIIGDFAFAIWDEPSQRLFCARDHIGIRPFYYFLSGRLFLFGSEPHLILRHPDVHPEPNEGMIGEYLANQVTSQEETLFRGVLRLPPAHYLIVTPRSVRKTRYWDADPSNELHYRADAEYAEHFLSVFGEAVRCRLRSRTPVGADLSGGLDSSSVVGLVQSLVRRGAVLDKGFEAFSLVFPGTACDESPYIDAVVERWGLRANKLLPEFADADAIALQIRRHLDFPDYPNQTMSNPLSALAREKGIAVVLTGIGGDDWLGSGFPPHADLLRSGRWLALIRQLRQDPQGLGLMQNLQELLAIVLPAWVLRPYRWAVRRDGLPPWIDGGFARRVDLADRLRAPSPAGPFTSYAQRDIFLSLRSGEHTLSCELVDRSAARFGLENRHPFNDRRFIEFVLSLPQTQRQRDGRIKFIMRQAMRDLLPDLVRERQTKAEFSPVFLRAFETLGGRQFFASLSAVTQGWVCKETVCRMYEETLRASADDEGIPHVWPLWMIAGMDLWGNAALKEPIGRMPPVRPYRETAVSLASSPSFELEWTRQH